MTTHIGRGITFVGSVLLLASLFISAYDSEFGGESIWRDVSHTSDVLLIFALVGIGLAVASLFVRPALLLMIAAGLGLLALGFAYVVPLELAFGDWKHLRGGYFLAAFGSLAMAAGGILGATSLGALSGLLSPAGTIERQRRTAAPAAPAAMPAEAVVAPPTAPGTPASAPPPPPAPEPVLQPRPSPGTEPEPAPAAPAGPEPGWYPDPAAKARLRYWTGEAWSEHTAE
jgi:hypothetical protein